MMTFRNPYNVPLSIRSLIVSNQIATLRWTAVPGERYRVESSARVDFWPTASTNIVAAQTEVAFSASATNNQQFFRLLRVR